MNDASPFHRPEITGNLVESFTGFICDGDEAGAAMVIDRLLGAGVPAETLMLDLLAPAARLMGDCWCEDRRDFMEVTLGLARLQQLVRQFRLPATRGAQLRGHALLLPVPGEQHTFGLRIVEEHLLRAGWTVAAVLKADEPEIARLVAAETYDFVGFSVTSERLLPALRSAIRCVRTSSRNRNVRIAVGGVLFDGREIVARDIDADAIVKDAQDAVTQARAWSALAGVE